MQKFGQNFNKYSPDTCPICGTQMSTLPAGLRQCPNICPGAVWDPMDGWDPAAKEALREAKIERERYRKPHPLQPVADYLDYSVRQTITLVQRGQVLGVGYAGRETHISSHGWACVGPIPDDRFQRFTLPRGAESVATEVCSGTVSSGFINVRTDIVPKKLSRHLEARAEAAHSGLMLGVVCFDASGDVIPPPLIYSSGQPLHSAYAEP